LAGGGIDFVFHADDGGFEGDELGVLLPSGGASEEEDGGGGDPSQWASASGAGAVADGSWEQSGAGAELIAAKHRRRAWAHFHGQAGLAGEGGYLVGWEIAPELDAGDLGHEALLLEGEAGDAEFLTGVVVEAAGA
jgi:hypothetical protein